MSKATELIRDRVRIVITRALDSYGNFPIETEKKRFYRIAVDLILEVIERIENGDTVTLSPIKTLIAAGVFSLGFDNKKAEGVFKAIFQSIYSEIDRLSIVDPDTVRVYEKYESLILEATRDYVVLLKDNIKEYLGNLQQYGVARNVNLPPTKSRLLKVNRVSNPAPIRSRLSEKFSPIFERNVNNYADIISGASRDINSITSDSKIPSSLDLIGVDRLVATFSGEGKKIYTDISVLYDFSVEIGGYEGSFVGAVEYQSRYYEYLMSMCYGKYTPQGVLSGEFGNFELLYGVRTTSESIGGLKFLENLYTTYSANQGVSVPEKYGEGIEDRYVYKTIVKPDFVSLALESVYVLCLKVGDTIQSLLNNPPDGIGNTDIHLKALARVFPSSLDLELRSTGFTGAIGSLLSAHKTLYQLLGYEPDLQDFNDRLYRVSEMLSTLIRTLRTAGFKPGGHVASLELTYYDPDRDRVKERLIRLGFSDIEVQDIMSCNSFLELLEKFAPVTDSQDVISLFRAYDLTKLIYEFGGQEAIDWYIDFLYGKEDDKQVLRILEYLDRNRSSASKITENEYSKLIGYLVTITYAVDPERLTEFNTALEGNNLDLFESITYLLEQGTETILKTPESISLLSGMVAQMVVADNSGYESQKPLWNDLIQKSSGNAKNLEGIYSKVEGITPTELYSILGGPSATSPLGKILDGVRGGRLTSLLRYCNLFGLLYTLSSEKNSGQLANIEAERYTVLLDLSDTMEILSERLQLAKVILDENSKGDRSKDVYTDPVVQAQNKEFSALIRLVSSPEEFDPDQYRIIESPGTGNSRVSNGIRITNSLTPEESAVISRIGDTVGVFTGSRNTVEDGSYVRIAISNLLANGVQLTGTVETETGPEISEDNPVVDYRVTYNPNPSTGSQAGQTGTYFDPLTSCLKFGSTNCVEQGYSEERCSVKYNKSLFPEEGYGLNPSFVSGSVLVDRPLGSKMNGLTVYLETPASHPQSYFSSNGLSKKIGLGKEDPMLCASLRDPYEYGACMSLMKCRKFVPPYAGRYSLPFCPSTSHGGRLER